MGNKKVTKKGTPSPKKRYRYLKAGELVRKGDEWFSTFGDRKWRKTRHAGAIKAVGCKDYRREVPKPKASPTKGRGSLPKRTQGRAER